MSQEKAQLIAPIDSSFTVPGVTVSGVITATSFDGTITGVADSITQGKNLNVGVVTALSFAGNLTGNAGGLIGSPNTTAGVVTATSFVGDLSGNATSLTGSPNLNLGVTTATRFTGDVTGNAVGDVTGEALSATVSGITTTNNISVGVITATSFHGGGGNLDGVGGNPVSAQTVPDNKTYSIDVTSPAGGNYTLSGTDRNGSVSGSDPAVTVEIGDTLNFVVDASGHPFYIRVSDGGANVSTPAATNQGAQSGTVSWTPNTAGTYYYQCGNHAGMIGTITVAATTTIDLSSGNLIYFNQSANTTVSFANTSNGIVYIIRVKDATDTARTITWPTGIGWSGGSSPTLINNPRSNESQIFELVTRNEGVAWYGKEAFRYDPQTYNTFVWGEAAGGSLGLNEQSPGDRRSSPTQLPGATWKSSALVQSLAQSSVVTKTDGTLWSWGKSDSGCLGLNQTNNTRRSSPTQIGTDTNWGGDISIAGSSSQCSVFAVKATGELFSWGYKRNGKLGVNFRTNVSSPTQLPGTTWRTVRSYSAGWPTTRAMGVKTDGTLWGWGGLSTTIQGAGTKSSPVQVGTDTTWGRSFHLQRNCSHWVKTDGTLWWSGKGDYGETGNNNNTLYSSPRQLGTDTTWATVTGEFEYKTIAGKTDGTLWAWGQNEIGMLGINQSGDAALSSPAQVGTDTDWDVETLHCGNNFTLCNKTDGSLWSWGQVRINSPGTPFTSSSITVSSPCQISGTETNWKNARALDLYACIMQKVDPV